MRMDTHKIERLRERERENARKKVARRGIQKSAAKKPASATIAFH